MSEGEDRGTEIAMGLFDAERIMKPMTPEERWAYVVRLQDGFWAAVSYLENLHGVEIESGRELCSFSTMAGYVEHLDKEED